jgi:hypothetical protein
MSVRKGVPVILAFFLLAPFAFASDEPAFMPMVPQIMGQGGADIASANGYASFFTNPAGFSMTPGDLTLLTTTTWMYARPDRLLEVLGGLSGGGDASALIPALNNEITTGGLGVGALTGIGWASNGLGLGAFFVFDSYLYGRNLLGVTGDVTATMAFFGGLSFPLDLGFMKISIGGDIRPMIRMRSILSSAEALGVMTALIGDEDVMSVFNAADALYGAGIGLDLGAIAELGPFSFGLSVRDLFGTGFNYRTSPIGTVIETLASTQTLPEGEAVTDQYVIPMDIAAGVSFHPDLGDFKFFIDPTVHIDLSDVIGVIRDLRSPWALLHIGAEVKLLSSIISLDAGLDQGYLTAGAGVHLLFLDANVSMFTRELGKMIGDRPSSGVSVEAAIRF